MGIRATAVRGQAGAVRTQATTVHPRSAGCDPAGRCGRAGFTLLELVIVVAIVGILASAALPLARWSQKRTAEIQLQQALRILRNGIDRYHDAAQAGLIEVPEGSSGYPPSLDVLVQGVPLIGQMPPLMPAVSDEYQASGAGLTGGLSAQLAEGQQGSGLAGTAGTAGNVRGGARQPGAGLRPGSGAAATFAPRPGTVGSSGPGGRSLFSGSGVLSRGTSAFGRSGFAFGQGGAQPGLRPGLGAGLLRGGADAGQGSGGAGAKPQPLLGPDGQPVNLVFLRRLPVDPFTGKAEWGLRCYGEPPEDHLWCGRDVFDVYSKSFAKAIDGTNYRDW